MLRLTSRLDPNILLRDKAELCKFRRERESLRDRTALKRRPVRERDDILDVVGIFDGYIWGRNQV